MKFISQSSGLPDIRQKHLTGFTIFIVIFCLLNPIFDIINHKFTTDDFYVYFNAAKDLITGGSIYGTSYGLDLAFYKYSPLMLLVFVPSTLLPFKLAAGIHLVLLGFSFWYSFLLVKEIFSRHFFPGIKKHAWLLTLGAMSVMIFMVKELHLGNINIFLLMLILISMLWLAEGKIREGSVLLGLVILVKPFFGILVLPLLFRKRFREATIIGMTFLAGVVLPMLILGFRRGFSLHADWLRAILDHSAGYSSKNSIYHILSYNFFPGLPDFAANVILLAGILLACLFIFINIRHENRNRDDVHSQPHNLLFESFILIAMIPAITSTDTNVFLTSIPVITFIIYYISFTKKMWLIPVMVVLAVIFGGNSQDLLGAELSKRLFYMGWIGISNLLMIILALILYIDIRKKPAAAALQE